MRAIVTGAPRRVAWVASIIFVQFVVALVFGIASPPYADEIHYHRTVLRFVEDPSVRTMSTYDEVTAPLTFVIYALWGTLFGSDLPTLRCLSLLLAFILQFLLYLLIERVSGSARRAYWLGVVMVLNPYMLGLNVVVYTDVLALIGLVVLLHGMIRRNAWLVLLGSACATLSRQYMIFATGATCLYLLVVLLHGRDRRDLMTLVATALSALPLLALFALWGGSAPPEGRLHWLQGEVISWRPSYVVAYVAMLPVYVLPVIVWRWRTLYGERSLWLWSLPFVPLFAVAPVAPSEITLRLSEYETIGIVHRGLVSLFGDGPRVEGLLFAFWVLGLPVILWIARDAWRRRQRPDLALYLDLAILAFIAVMPVSFHVWEKYLLPLLPVVLCRFSLTGGIGEPNAIDHV